MAAAKIGELYFIFWKDGGMLTFVRMTARGGRQAGLSLIYRKKTGSSRYYRDALRETLTIGGFVHLHLTTMKKFYFWILVITFIVSSCKKESNVHFHGRITYKCNGAPLGGINLIIQRIYDTGSTQIETVGYCTTDNNGYYSLITDVSQSGHFSYYHLSQTSSPPPLVNGDSHSNEEDVLMNVEVESNSNVNCHIKNTSPFNSSDVFDTLQIANSFTSFYFQTIIANLIGSSVDTTITLSASSDNFSVLKYSYTKNSVTTTQYDTITSGCFNITTVDIFY